MPFGKSRISGQLALLTVVPLLGVVALSVPVIVGRVDDAQHARPTSDTVRLASQASTALQELREERQGYSSAAQYRHYLDAQDAFTSRVGIDFRAQAEGALNTAVQHLNGRTLLPSIRSVPVLGGFVEKRVAADVRATATANGDAALRDAFLIGGGSLVLLFLIIGLRLVMARAVARPLRRLTVSADRMARAAATELERVADDDAEAVRPIRLDPVDVEAQDEIGDLARAFDRVQATAVQLVERQVLGRRNLAQMFGHMGRRTQNLVGRQLALIDNLKRNETDGDRLRELCRLDHMSRRLRRNASSLVVISGGASANEHTAPISLSDVVRLALSEIEDYPRIDVEVPEHITMTPAVAADLTLMLAELMENATSFSPPQTRVLVSAIELHGGARLAVVDNGLGMTPERLAEENARLTRRERLDLVPTEVLGLFVVGRLARRHGIRVTLTGTSGGGATTWVDLAPALLIQREPPSSPVQVTSIVGPTAEFVQVIGGSAGRSSVPGRHLPFDPAALDRATQTLKAGQSWNAFATTVRAEAGPAVITGQADDAEPVHPNAQAYRRQVPRQRQAGDFRSTGRYEVHASPAYGGSAPAQDEARAARAAFEAFEAGVLRAQWDATEAGLIRNQPADSEAGLTRTQPAATGTEWSRARRATFAGSAPMRTYRGRTPLARREPGASLPNDQEGNPTPPVLAPPLDPDAARALVEQFERGVAQALNEIPPQPEGQPR